VYYKSETESTLCSRNAYQILVAKLKGKIPVGRPRHTWKDNIKTELNQEGCEDMDWMHLAQDRV
jgi:hypothetical protein